MHKILFLTFIIFMAISTSVPFRASAAAGSVTWWDFQSIDTMKYSRDLAREKLEDSSFDSIINEQVQNIASVGATHVAIATPYDEEFIPFLKKWVYAARKYRLNVWFRGNWSGWEGWFNYARIDRQTHIQKTVQFISRHKDLFVDGDVFSGCPECENGGPGDPRNTKDVDGYRQFLIDEYTWTKKSFDQIGKKVTSNYFSMNADVANLIMDKPTTAKLGGIVTIDHYVKNPKSMAEQVDKLVAQSGGKIVIGEFGAPIEDINGSMTALEQSRWIEDVMQLLADRRDKVVGVNYWVSVGGDTQIWNNKGQPSPAVNVIRRFYSPSGTISLLVKNDFGKPVANVPVNWMGREYFSDQKGQVNIPVVPLGTASKPLIIEGAKAGFSQVSVAADLNSSLIPVSLSKPNPGIWYRIESFIFKLLGI